MNDDGRKSMEEIHGLGRRQTEGDGPVLPPHNLSAEAAVLGALLFDNAVYDQTREALRADDFYAPAHQAIYAHASALIEMGQTADGVTMNEWSKQEPAVAEIGGAGYLIQLLDAAAFGPELRDYCVMIRDLGARRALIRIGTELQEYGVDTPADVKPSDLVERARDGLQAIEDMRLRGSQWEATASSAARVFADMEDMLRHGKPGEVRGLKTGIPDLDRRLGGLIGGRLIIVGGRPGMGKSGFASNVAASIAADIARDGNGNNVVGFFSLEMEKADYDRRLISSLAHKTGAGRVEYQDVQNGSLGQNEFSILREGGRAIPKTLYVDQSPALSVGDIAARARALRRSAGRLDLILIDYLQIMNLQQGRNETKTDALGRATSGLKRLAKELHVPVIALSQLSRALESRENKRPMLSDLRESGSIEQDADQVIFCYRDDYYLERSEPPHGNDEQPKVKQKWMEWWMATEAAKGVIELICAKNRHGKVGTVKAHYDAGTDCLVASKGELDAAEQQSGGNLL